jgi:hypothetical protein
MMQAKIHPRGTNRYSVIFDGRLLAEGSRDPECDSARALLAKGFTGKLTLLDGKTGRPRAVIDIWKAARLTTEEGPNGPRFRQFRAVERVPTAPKSDHCEYAA